MLDETFNAVITDFGFVTPLPTTIGSTALVTAAGTMTVTKNKGYLAPEIADGKHGVPSDIYSYGVVSCKHPSKHSILTLRPFRLHWKHSQGF